MKEYTRKLKSTKDINAFVQDNEQQIKKLYLNKGMTARKVAERLNVEYTPAFQKACFRYIGPKGHGWGGSRPGSGNKKGVRFCGRCRQLKKNCKCKT